jgi:hypothetical protein
VNEIMRYARSLSEAFRDEMAYCIEGPRGQRMGFYVKRRPWWWRIWRIFK